MDGYAGPGYVGLLRAAFQLACDRHPYNWRGDNMSSSEASLWHVLISNPGPLIALGCLDRLHKEFEDSWAKTRREDFDEALDTIRGALESGSAHAFVWAEDGSRLPVNQIVWTSSGAKTALETGWTGSGHELGLNKLGPDLFLIVPKHEIFDLRTVSPPALTTTSAPNQKPKANAETSFRKELTELMSSKPESPEPRDAVIGQAMIRFPGLSKRGARRIWSDTAEKVAPRWSMAGARKREAR